MSQAKQSWNVEGQYFESCNCAVLCPCLLSQSKEPATEGHCDVVLGFRVDNGSFDGTELSGLTAAVGIYTPGPKMSDGNWTMAPYVDSRASEAQRQALEAIFTGSAGGPMARLSALVTKRLPAKAVPIDFVIEGNTRKLSIPGVTEVTVEGITGPDDNVVWLENVRHFASRKLAAAKGVFSHFKDHGLDFDNTGRNGHFAPIKWASS